MDFYLQAKRFLTDLAVNAKSCLNSIAPLYYKREISRIRCIHIEKNMFFMDILIISDGMSDYTYNPILS